MATEATCGVSDAGTNGAADFTLERDAWGRLVLVEADGRRHPGVVPVRGFPFTAPRQGVSLCGPDGQELRWLARLDELPPHLLGPIEEELARREFVPLILRVRKVTPRLEPSEWEVDTDRGPARFVLNSPDDVRRLDDRRAMIVDAHGTRYLISDMSQLDAISRRALERYL